MLDLVITDARVVDGSGRPAYQADVAIQGSTISEIGNLKGVPARHRLNATGRVLAPGFIDLHTHVERHISHFPRAEAMVRQGVTTVIGGNCGSSPFPHAAGRAASTTPSTGDEASSFMEHLATLPLSLNIGLLVGHGSLRAAAMGFENRKPSPGELLAMQRLLKQALHAGVFGMSTGLIYAPGNFAETDELVQLARLLTAFGGIYATHLRGEGAELPDSIDEALSIGRRTGSLVHISHLKTTGRSNWGSMRPALRRIERARSAGLDVSADQYPYTASSTTMTAFLSPRALDGGTDRLLERLSTDRDRSAIRRDLSAQDPLMLRKGVRAFEPSTIRLASMPPPLAALEGRHLTDVADEWRLEPADAALRLIQMSRGEARVILFSMSEDDVREGLRDHSIAIASDGGTLSPAQGGRPHPRSYGTFARVLETYVRKDGLLSLEAAVKKMSAIPARRLGLTDRGRLVVSAAADLVLFDPDEVTATATYDEPHSFCRGVSHVIVNGHIVIEDGEDTGAAAGHVLRRHSVSVASKHQ